MKSEAQTREDTLVTESNQGYTAAVEHNFYPANPLVPLGDKFEDERGVIQNLLFTDVKTVSLIVSKKGTERSNHYHKTDWHYLYVLQGEMEYYERELSEQFLGKPIVVKAGQMVFTPPNVVHKTVFTKDTTLLSCAKNVRSYELHEADTVREKF